MDERLEKMQLEQDARDANQRYKEHVGAGIGLGLLSAGAAVAVGAVCPLCVVAVPALVGSGLYQRYKQHCTEKEIFESAGEASTTEEAVIDSQDGEV